MRRLDGDDDSDGDSDGDIDELPERAFAGDAVEATTKAAFDEG